MVSIDDELAIISYNDENMTIIKKILSFLINHNDFKYENNKAQKESIEICCNKIITIGKYKINKNYTSCVISFINLLISQQPEQTIDSFFGILDNFIKQLQSKKKLFDSKKIIKNINNLEHETSDKPINIVNYIFTT